jgi:REP element-mobilizing transposase RayT
MSSYRDVDMKSLNHLPTRKSTPGHWALHQGRYSEPNRLYLLTTVTYRRQQFFSDLFTARLVVSEMRRVHEEGLIQSLAWVLMPDHLHWMFGLNEHADLKKVMQLVKGRSAHYINERLSRKGKVWDKAYHDHALRKDEDVKRVARYIVANPLRKRLVKKIIDYPLWDAVWI